MINRVPYNYHKPDDYKYYHICFLKYKEKREDYFNKSKEDIIQVINSFHDYDNFIVKGTIDNIESCLRYVNEKENHGVVFCMQKEDIFKSTNPIFANCTEYFKGLLIKN